MTKENKEKKRTGRMAFTWETEVEVKKTNRMFVLGTDIEVEWCPITKMLWEVQSMIAEDAVVNMDKNLDRIRAAGDIKRFFAKKRLGIYLTEEGAEGAREYVKLFEESSK